MAIFGVSSGPKMSIFGTAGQMAATRVAKTMTLSR